MQFSYISAAFLALASTVVAEVYFDAIQTPARDEILPAGKPFDLVWTPLDVTGTATIQLLHGLTNTTLQLGPIIKAGVNNQDGKYTWAPTDLGFKTYGWTITLDSDKTKVEYSKPFAITGSGPSSLTGQITTVHLSTNPSYIASATSTSALSTSSISASSTYASSTYTSSLVSSVVSKSNVTSTNVIPTPSAGSNATYSTLVATTTSTPTQGSGSGSGASSTKAPAAQSSSAAMANMVTGGIAAVGGLVMAFAL